MTSEALPPAADPLFLTDVLRRAGVLGDARVRDAKVESSQPTLLSRITCLRLTYDGAALDAPNTLILKSALTQRMQSTWNAGRQEVAFYRDVAPVMPADIVPRCFDAAWDEATNAWHLLLEDLTDTHRIVTQWPLPPSAAQCEGIITAWARFHAAWWDDPRLGTSIGRWPSDAEVEAYLRRLAQQFARFADQLGELLPRERRTLFERFVSAASGLYERRQRHHRNLTIAHGDAHFWNCFLARDQARHDIRLFDWDSWRLGMATGDLAYMMAMHWYPDRRRRLEGRLLDHYHTELMAQGVEGYDRRALEEDYRRSALWLLAYPVWQAASDIPPVIWWNNLERILLAVDDLGCIELLD